MKTLYLVRHAKSSWKEARLADIDRPLNKRGKRDAPEMGQRLAKGKIYPGLIVSSPAKRALHTAQLIASEINYKKSAIVVEESIYEAYPSDLLDVIRAFPVRIHCVLMVGHIPGMTDLVNQLTGSKLVNMPTCAIAQIRIPTIAWDKLIPGKAKLIDFDFPKKEI